MARVAGAERWEPLFSRRSSIGGWNCWKIASCCLVTRSSRHRPRRPSSKTDPSLFLRPTAMRSARCTANRHGDGIVLNRRLRRHAHLQEHHRPDVHQRHQKRRKWGECERHSGRDQRGARRGRRLPAEQRIHGFGHAPAFGRKFADRRGRNGHDRRHGHLRTSSCYFGPHDGNRRRGFLSHLLDGQRQRDQRGLRRSRCEAGFVSIGASDGTITLKSTTGLTFINDTKNGGKWGDASGTSAASRGAGAGVAPTEQRFYRFGRARAFG